MGEAKKNVSVRTKKWLTSHFWGVMIVVGIMLVAVVLVAVMSYVSVPAGHKAVVTCAPDGEWIGKTLNEGWHFNPYFIFCDIEVIRYNMQTIEFSVMHSNDSSDYNVYGPVNVRTFDNLEVFLGKNRGLDLMV